MSLKATPGQSPAELAAEFKRIGSTTSKRALRAMRKVAKAVKDESVANAPLLHGDLEAAHRIVEVTGDLNRLETRVEIGNVGLTRDDVDEYAGVIDAGGYELGERSRAKAASNGHIVGPDFLGRAFDKYQEQLDDDLLDEILGDLL